MRRLRQMDVRKPERDRYWSLDIYWSFKGIRLYRLLIHRGYDYIDINSPKGLMVSTLQRHDRGLLCYPKCSISELQTFTLSRKLPPGPSASECTYEILKSMIRNLEDADEARRFRFMDVPTEIRQMVIENYISDFAPVLKTPTQPPLAKTCRRMRQEVLPVFYKNLTFEIHLRQSRHKLTKHNYAPTSALFLRSLSPKDFSTIRKLRLVVVRTQFPPSWSMFEREARIVCTFELQKDGSGFRFEMESPRPGVFEPWISPRQRLDLREKMGKWVEGLAVVEGRRQFRWVDLTVLKKVVNGMHGMVLE